MSHSATMTLISVVLFPYLMMPNCLTCRFYYFFSYEIWYFNNYSWWNSWRAWLIPPQKVEDSDCICQRIAYTDSYDLKSSTEHRTESCKVMDNPEYIHYKFKYPIWVHLPISHGFPMLLEGQSISLDLYILWVSPLAIRTHRNFCPTLWTQ